MTNLSRRSAVKTLAAAIMAPIVTLRREIDREALLLPFCGESYRYNIEHPFQCGSLTYATDAKRMARTELSMPELCGERRLPPVTKAWSDLWQPTAWREIERPAIGDLIRRQGYFPGVCPLCLGREISLGDTYPDEETIEDLTSRGVRWDVDHNTIGDESCPQCRGKEYYGPSVLRIGRQRFEFALLSPIWNLPGPVRVSVSSGRDNPLLFAADGFEGIVMPLA